MTLSLFWFCCYRAFESRKKVKERCKCKGVRMTLSPFGCGAKKRLKAVKNAKCEVNFVPNKKAAPQFAFANEEPLIEVRCKIHPQSAFFLLFFHLDLVIGLNNIPHLDVVVGLDVQTTLHIERNLLHIVLETLERA